MSGMDATLALLGANEKNRALVENELDVQLTLRGGELKIEGQQQNVDWARQVMEKNFRTCRTYATLFSRQSGNLLFIGGTGLGKTFLSACIARTVADRGYSVVYETASRLFNKLERAKFNGDEEARKDADKYLKCDLLIIDDLGTEMPGQFVTAALYSLVNDRLLAGTPMVISTNLNVDELSRRYSPQIASRLHGSFNRLTFLGEDIRVLKNRGQL
jgi:DNA replication protein DnaC